MDSRERLTPASSSPSPLDQAGGWASERTRVAVGPNTNISGKLIFQEPVRIEGTFKGEVTSSELVVIAPGARIIDGRVRAARLVVLGQLLGDVLEAERVVLGPKAIVNGDICTAYLTIQDGAVFNGKSRMLDARAGHKPVAGQPAHSTAG